MFTVAIAFIIMSWMQRMPHCVLIFKDLFWNMMRGMSGIVESLPQFSEPRRNNSLATIETSCYTIQNVEWSDALVCTNNVLQCPYSTLRPINDAEESLNPTMFDVPDSSTSFSENYSMHEIRWNGHAPPTKRNAINVNTTSGFKSN